MAKKKEKVIPDYYIPDKESFIVTIEGQRYLVKNDAMYTFYRRTKGEFSEFFLALRDERKLLGCKCQKCGIVRVPPFLTHCPDCNFAPTELIEVEQTGVMNSTPPITYFATSLFQSMAPFGRGRVIFRGADTAMSSMLYTTTGILTPGIIVKGTEMKLVFRDERLGEMTDVFCVPAKELSKSQLKKKGLLESEINWGKPVEPKLGKANKQEAAQSQAVVDEIKAVVKAMNENERARKDIAGWKRNVLVKVKGGEFTLAINDGNIRVKDGKPAKQDFVMVCEDPRVLLDGLAYRGALTDSVINKKLWISKNMEFTTIFKLDRMARSLARSKKT